MISQELIGKINALSKKSKEEGLTEEEKVTQKELRAEYLVGFRRNMRAELDTIKIVD